MKKGNSGSQQKFVSFFRQQVKDIKAFETPLALYHWLLQTWEKPMNSESQRQAYLAAWAFSIDRGLVKL